MMSLIPTVRADFPIEIGEAFHLGQTGNAIKTYGTLSTFLSPIVKDTFVLAGVIFVALLVFGGVTYIMNAGSADKEGMEKGKNALTAAIAGFIIIFAAYWIVQIVQFVAGVDIFNTNL